jgi:hypothetical protein
MGCRKSADCFENSEEKDKIQREDVDRLDGPKNE